MVRLFFTLIFAVLLAFGGYWFFKNPGLVTLTWMGLELRLPIFVVLLSLTFGFFAIVIAYKLLRWFFRVPFRMSQGWSARKREKAAQEVVHLAEAVEAENGPEALKHMKQAKKAMGKDTLFWWYGAQAQGLRDKHMEQNKSLGKLMELSPFLALKGQAQAALRRKDIQSAMEFLDKAWDVDPNSLWVMKQLLDLYKRCKKYEEAELVINKLEDLNYFSRDQGKRELALLYDTMFDDPHMSDQDKEEALRKAHYLDPSLSHVTEQFVKLLMSQGHVSYALTALEATWKESPSEVLGDLYVDSQKPKTSLEGYEMVKKLVKKNVTDPESQLLLAKYAMKAKLWGEARKLLIKLEDKAPSGRVYGLLAELEMKEHNNLKEAHEWALKGCKV